MGMLRRRGRLAAVCLGIMACGCAAGPGPAARAVSATAGPAVARAGAVPRSRQLSVSAPAMPAQGIGQQVRTLELPELRAIGAPGAWRISRGRGVTVGVLDTGTDGGVPDLIGSVRSGPDFAAGADPAGFRPPHLHGTFIASLIAGHGSGPGRSEGVIGVAPAARVLAIRVILDDGEPGMSVYDSNPKYADAIANGIYYAVKHGVRVINMSLGAPDPTHDMRAAIAYAITRGVVIVASAGNSGTAHGGYTPYGYPAAYTGVISVAALTPHGARAWFSDRNSSVVVAAPGVSVVGAGPGGEYLQADGTSPAAAFVSGVVALIQARHPGLSPALIEQALITTTTHRPRDGYNTSVGFGEVNAPAALAAASRLAGVTAAGGLASAAHFGPQNMGAIQVTHRDTAVAAGEITASAAGGLGFLAACALLVVAIRRRGRGRSAALVVSVPPGGGPPVPPGAGGMIGPATVGADGYPRPGPAAPRYDQWQAPSAPHYDPPPARWAPPDDPRTPQDTWPGEYNAPSPGQYEPPERDDGSGYPGAAR